MGWLRMKSGAWGVGGASFPSGTTWSAVARGRARRSTSASRTPRHTAVPTAPFSHWRPDAGGLWKLRPLPGALERDGLGHRLEPPEIVEAQRQRVLDLPVDREHAGRRVDDRPVVVVPDEEEVGRRDVGGQLPERRLEVDGPRAPDDQLVLPGDRARRGGRRLAPGGQASAQERRRGADLDDEGAPGEILHGRAWLSLMVIPSEIGTSGGRAFGPRSGFYRMPLRPAPLGVRRRTVSSSPSRPRILASVRLADRLARASLLAVVTLGSPGCQGPGPPKAGAPPHHLERRLPQPQPRATRAPTSGRAGSS